MNLISPVFPHSSPLTYTQEGVHLAYLTNKMQRKRLSDLHKELAQIRFTFSVRTGICAPDFLLLCLPPSVWLTCLRYFQEVRQWKKTEESPQNTSSLLPLMSNPEKCRYKHIHTLTSSLLISEFPQLSKGFFEFPSHSLFFVFLRYFWN